MKIAVLSDIHGNHVSFQACMEHLKKEEIDIFVFLGDYVGEFPGIRQSLEMIRTLSQERTCYVLRGNKEDYQLNGLGGEHPEWDPYPSTIGMFRYGAQSLTGELRDYIRCLPITDVVKVEGFPDIRICHGSPRDVKEGIYENAEINAEIFREIPENYILCGHTHRVTFLEEYGKTVWNPGSVGVSLDGNPTARFLILHGEEGDWRPEFFSIPYDTEQLIREMKEEGFYEIAPYWTRVSEHLLRGGTMNYLEVLTLAVKIAREKYGSCEWPAVPEDCWAEAYEKLIGTYA